MSFLSNFPLRSVMDYIPIILVTLLFISEKELEIHALNMSCQTIISLIAIGIFFITAIKFKKPKVFAFVIAVIFWIMLVCLRKNIFPQPIPKL